VKEFICKKTASKRRDKKEMERSQQLSLQEDALPDLPPPDLTPNTKAAVEASLHGGVYIGSSFNLLNSVLAGGISLIPLPYCAKLTGLSAMPLLLLGTGLMAGFSALTLVRVSALTGSMTYDGAAEAALGSRGALAVNIIITCANFGVCVALLDVFGDIIPALVDFDRTVAVGCMCLVLLPACVAVRRIEALSWASAFATFCTLLFLVMVLGRGATVIGTPDAPPMCAGGCDAPASDVLLALSEICMSWVCHFNVLPIFEGLLLRASDAAYEFAHTDVGAGAEAAGAMRVATAAMHWIIVTSLSAAFLV